MKKFLILSAVFSLILFSGCNLFSGKDSEENVQNKEIQDNQVLPADETKTDDQASPEEETEVDKQVLLPEKVEVPPQAKVQAEAQTEAQNMPEESEESAESPEARLAKCITAKGAVLYTSTTCPHCKTQKDLFNEGLQFLKNIDCNAMDGWAQVCLDNEVNAVPTWVLADGQKIVGTRPLGTLAETIGCEYTVAS